MPSTAIEGRQWSLPLFLLKRWLRGRWALLFSHPDDFAHYGFEADRWIGQVKETFHAESIAALAFGTRAGGQDAGWIAASGGCFIGQRTFDGIAAHSDWCDCGASACATSERRFVMILDGALQLRRTFVYSRGDLVPSPIGLASLAAACRFRAQSKELRVAC